VALIEGGSFYRLENTGTGPMILMGTRTGPNSANKHINYETGKDIKGTTELVRGAGVADPRAHS
jgi:hypothetical protein